MYLYELINWLTTVVDSLQTSGSYKDEAYRAATAYIAQCLMVRPLPSPHRSSCSEWSSRGCEGGKRLRVKLTT
jgi:hypothetical protein